MRRAHFFIQDFRMNWIYMLILFHLVNSVKTAIAAD